MEARNRFKGLDVIDRVPDELGTEARDHSHRKVMQKSKMAVWRGLTNSREEKRSKKQRRKGKIFPSECRVPKNSKEREESRLRQLMQRNRGKE